MPPAAPECSRRRLIPRCCRGRFPARAAHLPAGTAVSRAWDAPWPSSRDLPGCAVLGILEHNAHGGEFVADTVGFLEVFCRARIGSRLNQADYLAFVDGDRRAAEGGPFGRRQLK